jgi:WD40 repeat protein
MMRKSLLLVVSIALLTPSADAQLNPYSPFVGGKNKVRYDKFKWHTYRTPHFVISYYDRVEPSLEKIASYAESSYDELAHKLNFQINKPIPLIAYATHAEFEQTNIIVGFIPEGVGAFASPVRNRMVLPVDLNDRELQALIQHELTHIFQYEIYFGGRRGRMIYARPPQWFMEGMASYFGDDETSLDEMYMRDASMADMVPSIRRPPVGFLSYRFGHKVFEFIEEEWGEDAVRDFVFSLRGNFGSSVNKPVGKTFKLDPEEFDAAFRGWLRKKYAHLSDRGAPREFGQPFKVAMNSNSQQSSPVLSPSGDLVAAFTTYKNDVDVAIFGVPDRRLYKNLTRGRTTKIEYLIAQGLTVGPSEGRDLDFSPDGDHVAVFARQERGRSLLLLDVLHGGIDKVYRIPLPLDQPMNPAFHPDGRRVAFTAIANGRYDIYLIDLETEAITNLTDDAAYDAAPTFSPDGRYLVYSSNEGGPSKLVRLDMENPDDRDQLTFGPGTDEGAEFSVDGKRLYFASDRQDEIFDIYRLDLDSRDLYRLTYVSGGAVNPVPGTSMEGERVGFQAYHRGGWDLYAADADQGEKVGKSEPVGEEVQLEPFVPAVSITIDPEKGERLKRRKLYLEDAQVFVGVDNVQNFLSQTFLTFSDQYGDRRLLILFDTIDTFSNFRINWMNLEPRLQWGATLYDFRTFYITGWDPNRGDVTARQQAYRVTALEANGQYPFSRYYRAVGGFGYLDRQANYPQVNPETGEVEFPTIKDNGPFVTAGLAGDTTIWNNYGPHKGTRWELRGLYVYDAGGGGALTKNFEFDGRAYVPLSRRNELAFRLFLGMADGTRPHIYAIGGLDTIRGLPTRAMAGNRVGLANMEWRFPLIDRLDFSFLSMGGGIRGRLFLDIGAAWYDVNGQQFNYLGEPGFTFIDDGRLVDGVASYGAGITVFVLGMPMHWDWVQLWDFKNKINDRQVEFWMGVRF